MYRHNHVFGQKPRCPAIFRKKWPKSGKNGTFFTENGGASRVLPQNVVMPIHPLDPTQNYNRTLAFLKIPPSGRTLGPFPRDSETKLAKMGETVTKKEGKNILCPPNLLPLLDEEFDVDYDTVIKHDLILFFDQVMGIQS